MAPRRRQVARKQLTRWVADRRARRVPNFVIEMTGLDTKKIVTKYGANVAFELGKSAPPPSASAGGRPRASGEASRLTRDQAREEVERSGRLT